MIVDLPEDKDPILYVWGEMVPGIGIAASKFATSVYEHTTLGLFERGTQGALRFEVQGIVDGEPRIVVEHVTRITPGVAPDWPVPPDGGAGAHRVVIEGRPRIEVSLEATDEFVDGVGNRAAGGNATAANRLVNAIPWLRGAEPGLYDGLDVPLSPATGRLGRTTAGKALA